MKLTKQQRERLAVLTDEWQEQPDQWRAGIVFLRLEDRGLVEMEERRIKGGDIMTGPGNTSVYRWFTRRTPGGRKAIGLS